MSIHHGPTSLKYHTGKIQPCPCPACLTILDSVMYMGQETMQPHPGSLTLCVQCGTPSRYDQNMILQPLDLKEWTAIITDPQALLHIALFQAFVHARGALYPPVTTYAA